MNLALGEFIRHFQALCEFKLQMPTEGGGMPLIH